MACNVGIVDIIPNDWRKPLSYSVLKAATKFDHHHSWPSLPINYYAILKPFTWLVLPARLASKCVKSHQNQDGLNIRLFSCEKLAYESQRPLMFRFRDNITNANHRSSRSHVKAIVCVFVFFFQIQADVEYLLVDAETDENVACSLFGVIIR